MLPDQVAFVVFFIIVGILLILSLLSIVLMLVYAVMLCFNKIEAGWQKKRESA